ncbi:citrate lyase subunit beta/citryl-CoA lyase [Novosphingobium sp. PhB165]|uniref:HpcH/HpaI aldolase/citrate lyase family protein n=1 Tax=Novosphingobium sp. PhB165 TaxID=2485105 RepID=UPI00104EB50A|nr:CoA ester lyase [Novosphingobium sp. PhB165]TCM17766.1 citrate lyase subunit beta/citryl-CoA lyase [Novosphingobium sp. PhB165]
MKYRSWLIVPGNNEKRLGMTQGVGADVVVVDLGDTVPREARETGRRHAAQWLAASRPSGTGHRPTARWVRINSFESGLWREDLAAIMGSGPEGVILPRASGPDAVRELASEIYGHEERNGLAPGSTRIMPVAGETPTAALHISDYLESTHQRLDGLAWSAGGLGAALCVRQRRDGQGGWSDACRFVRAQVLLTAHASAIRAIEAPFEHFEDEVGLERAALRARADGFTGMFAVHPAQVAVINRAFAPPAEEFDEAREIVAAFAASPHLGSLAVCGRMVDRADLALAQLTLTQADRPVGIAAGSGEDLRRGAILRPA